MELDHAKLIGYHLRDHSDHKDPESHLPWAFAHAVADLPGPKEKDEIWLIENEPAGYWLSNEGSDPHLFCVTGTTEENPDRPARPRSTTLVWTLPLLKEDWFVQRASAYGQISRGDGFATSWEFRHESGKVIRLEGERDWDGGDAFLSDSAEKFAHHLARYLGWHFED